MESKTINKIVNLTSNPTADLTEIQTFLQDGWKIKEIHANLEQAGGKNLLYMTFTVTK